jgi:Ca2+-binding RTX toxin-like protein
LDAYIDGHLGNDTIVGTGGKDTFLGSAGNDSIDGGAGDDVINGGADNDTLIGNTGNDTLDMSGAVNHFIINLTEMSTGNTVLVDAALGTDLVNGFEGILLGSGHDKVIGSNGNNIIGGGAGNDTLDGGAGNDTLSFGGATAGISFDIAVNLTGTITVSDGQGGSDTVSNFEYAVGGSGNDTITGSAGANSISGGAGDDSLMGGLGADTLLGGDGNDLFVGIADNARDIYYGDAGFDTISYRDVAVAINTNTGTGFYSQNSTSIYFLVNGQSQYFNSIEGLIGGQANDVLQNKSTSAVYFDGYLGNDTLIGNNGADTLIGGAGNDSISGGSGADTLLGGIGDDTLSGGTGNDSIDGGDGNDRISFQTNAVINGGAGVDTLWFATSTTVNMSTLSTFAGSNFEAFDFLASGANVSMTLSSADVIALASASNAGIDNLAYANKKVLVINGNSGDVLNLTGGQWVDTGANTTFNLGGSFSIYQFGNSDIYVVTNLPPVTPPLG